MKVTTARKALSAALAVAAGIALSAQQPAPITRKILMQQDTNIAGREAVMAMVDIPVGSAEGRHTHPAEVYVFVLEGAPTLEVEGNPTVTLKAGDVFAVPSGRVHQAINNGKVAIKLAAVFVAEKGKPLTTPAK